MKDQRNKFKILIVEDDDQHAELIQFTLCETAQKPRVWRAADGEEAVAFLERRAPFEDAERPSLILLDLKLPKMDGLEVLDYIKNSENLKTIPVVMLTTSASQKDKIKAYESHVNSYLVKPMDFGDFMKLAQDVCNYWGRLNNPLSVAE
ncbi:response regulator [Acanthopleuribacter pedis]|uniref:Response regulator n=1 Tax=Acanthopleuribacter pedis TaxID=442870 RepID=A0A8J7U5I9_9BACT|nr:response regulator [Acanthopleuribacter pedis]MBO1319371.1 response regulator [Acanthopleuribacter pedis]